MADFVIRNAEWVEARGAGSSDDSQWLRCPVCGEWPGHVRHVATEIDPTGDENGPGRIPGTTETLEHRGGWRRPAVRIDVEGECGHEWLLLIQQHKGALILCARTGDRS